MIEKYHQLALQKQKEHRKVLANLKKKPPNLDNLIDEVFKKSTVRLCATAATLGPDFGSRYHTDRRKYFKMKLPLEAEFLQVDEEGTRF